MFRKSALQAFVPALGAAAVFGAALGLAAPAFAQDTPPPAPSTYPVCSAKVTDNCIQHEAGSQWADHHHMTRHTSWKHKATSKHHVAKKATHKMMKKTTVKKADDPAMEKSTKG